MRVIIILLVGLFFWSGYVSAAPQLFAEVVNYSFGEIVQGEQVEYVFQFRNAGDQVLEIGNLRSSCGCTVAQLSATRIAPGDTGELRTVFDSTRFRGAVSKVLSIDTNDPQRPQVDFSLYGDIRAELVLTPERVKWGKVTGDQPLTAEVKILNLGKTSIQLQPPQVTNPAVTAELSALQIAPNEQVQLLITAVFPKDKARLGGYVIIATDYSKIPQLRVPLSARLAK